jgi:hypothetical protein
MSETDEVRKLEARAHGMLPGVNLHVHTVMTLINALRRCGELWRESWEVRCSDVVRCWLQVCLGYCACG